jgi:glycosyltransferase involved in cell wall biosynthesis
MTEPFVSVLMPAYNAEEYVGEAIESVLDQSYDRFELVVVDDASTDDTWRIIQDHADQDDRVQPVRNEENLKVVKSRNKAFREASEEASYYAIMDADDRCKPERLERQVTFLEDHPPVGLVGSWLAIIDRRGERIGRREYPVSDEAIRSEMGWKNPVAQPSVMVRKAVIDDLGGYEEGTYDRAQDYELWCRVGESYDLHNLDEPLLEYRVFEEQGKATHLRETLLNTLRVQRKYFSSYATAKSVVLHVGLYLVVPLTLLPSSWLHRCFVFLYTE